MQKITIIYEDDVLLVCNKPAGLMVEPDRNNHPNLLNEVKKYLRIKNNNKSCYAQHLHRLDRPVSGLILFVKNKEYLRNLSEQFAQRTVEKHYTALTLNAPLKLQGRLEHWHRKEKKKAVIVPEGTEYAEKIILDYHVRKFGDFYKWEIQLHTGKFHQIRAQLANVGCPILGDTLYGSPLPYFENEIALNAYKLIITHPYSQIKIIFEIADVLNRKRLPQ